MFYLRETKLLESLKETDFKGHESLKPLDIPRLEILPGEEIADVNLMRHIPGEELSRIFDGNEIYSVSDDGAVFQNEIRVGCHIFAKNTFDRHFSSFKTGVIREILTVEKYDTHVLAMLRTESGSLYSLDVQAMRLK